MSRVFEALKTAQEEKKEFPNEVERDTSREKDLPPGWPGSDHRQSVTMRHPETLNGRKKWRDRVQELLLGWHVGRYKSYPIVALEKDSQAAEQYKILREQVKGLRNETGARSFSVTSPVKREGKTMVAVNLAVAMALEYEEQVLLIDGDLRSPDIHCYFDIKPTPGLTDYLSSNSRENLMEFVQDTWLPGLRILPAGRPSDLSSELLARLKMRNLIEEIRSKFPGHQIIVDAPPLLSTPDPLVLAREVEGIIMVIRADKTPREYLVKAIQSLNSNKLMGIVLNGVEMEMASKYYHSKKDF